MAVLEPLEWTDMDEERLARMEVLLAGGTEDLRRTRETIEQTLGQFDHRISMVEVHVRALQDKELQQKTLAQERERVAEETAERMVEHRHRVITRRDLWATAILLALAAVISALISAHII